MGPIEIFLLGIEDFHDTGRIADELAGRLRHPDLVALPAVVVTTAPHRQEDLP